MSKFVVAVGKVVVKFVAMQDLQNVQKEDIDNHLGQDDNYREDQVIVQVTLSNLIALRDFGLISKQDNIYQNEWCQEHSLSIRSISLNTTE